MSNNTFKRNFQSTSIPREFNIKNEAPETEELKRKIEEAKQEQLKSQEVISNFAVERIEYLTNIGRQYKDVVIDNHTFTLRTLKNKESKEITIFALKTAKNDLEASYELRRLQLANSLCKIDGHEIHFVVGSTNPNDILNFLDDLEENTFEYLYSQFEKLKEDVKNKFELKTQKDAEEVAEDLKKS